MSDKKSYSKKQSKKLINEVAERLAEILIMQIELREKRNKKYGKEKIR